MNTRCCLEQRIPYRNAIRFVFISTHGHRGPCPVSSVSAVNAAISFICEHTPGESYAVDGLIVEDSDRENGSRDSQQKIRGPSRMGEVIRLQDDVAYPF